MTNTEDPDMETVLDTIIREAEAIGANSEASSSASAVPTAPSLAEPVADFVYVAPTPKLVAMAPPPPKVMPPPAVPLTSPLTPPKVPPMASTAGARAKVAAPPAVPPKNRVLALRCMLFWLFEIEESKHFCQDSFLTKHNSWNIVYFLQKCLDSSVFSFVSYQ